MTVGLSGGQRIGRGHPDQPIALHDADLVLPLGCLRDEATAGYFGIHSGIFPLFSDAKTIQRFRGFSSLNGQGKRRRELAAEVDHVAWLLGINFTIQVVPAAGDRVLHVLAGESGAVRRQGRELYRAAWSWPVPQRASLVVAAIEGGTSHQTWENVGRALQVAAQFAEDGGSIAVCCELDAPPGPAMQQMASTSSREAALRQVGKERPVDALPAAQLAQRLERDKVYLLSRLDESVVEDLDMIPIAGPDELARLVRRHPSCILLSNAPYVTADRTAPCLTLRRESPRTSRGCADRLQPPPLARAARPATSRLVAVTKYVSADVVRRLVEAGCTNWARAGPSSFGKRRPPWPTCRSAGTLIGHLQRNKVRRTLPLVAMIHSVDSPRLLATIDEELASALFLVPRGRAAG